MIDEARSEVRALWRQVVAAHKAARSHSGIDYVSGFRDGLAHAYSTITGRSRQEIGDRARAEARQQQ